MTFKEKFVYLCNQKGEAPTFVCRQVGLSNAAYSCWTDESVPRRATLQRIADYFGVSVDYLLGKPETKKSPHLSEDLQKALDDSRANMAVVIGKGEARRVIEVPADAEEIIRAALDAFRDKK